MSKSLITADKYAKVMALDQTVKDSRNEIIEADKSGNTMMKALVLAQATRAIREQLTPMMPDIMQLVGSPLGFKTDKDRARKIKGKDGEQDRWDESKYSQGEVQDVVTVALLRGYQLVGNEINIIAGNFYPTKEGLERQIREFPGLKDLRLTAGVPSQGQQGALVHYEAEWTLNGEHQSIRCEQRIEDGKIIADTRIPIRVNDGMGVDAILGKAKSKMLRRIWERITGSQQSCVEDVEDGDSDPNVIDGTATVRTDESADQKPEANQEQTVEIDPAEVFRQFNEELSSSETIAAANKVYDAYFRSGKYQWTPKQNTAGLRSLENHHDKIRESCGAKSKKTSQKSLVS